MGIVWIKALTIKSGHANVIGHVDRVLAMMAAGVLDPTPLVTHHMPLAEAPGGLRGLRPARGAQDRDAPMSESTSRAADGRHARCAGARCSRQGAEPIGWKVGFNVSAVQEKLGIDGAAGGLSLERRPARGRRDAGRWSGGPVVVESEVAVELGEDGRTIVALLPALEVADPPDLVQDVETILAGNIFHRAVAFGPRVETRRRARRASS